MRSGGEAGAAADREQEVGVGNRAASAQGESGQSSEIGSEQEIRPGTGPAESDSLGSGDTARDRFRSGRPPLRQSVMSGAGDGQGPVQEREAAAEAESASWPGGG